MFPADYLRAGLRGILDVDRERTENTLKIEYENIFFFFLLFSSTLRSRASWDRDDFVLLNFVSMISNSREIVRKHEEDCNKKKSRNQKLEALILPSVYQLWIINFAQFIASLKKKPGKLFESTCATKHFVPNVFIGSDRVVRHPHNHIEHSLLDSLIGTCLNFN